MTSPRKEGPILSPLDTVLEIPVHMVNDCMVELSVLKSQGLQKTKETRQMSKARPPSSNIHIT
jgi:hypothetical protein